MRRVLACLLACLLAAGVARANSAPRIVAEFRGSYICAQGETALTLKVLAPEPGKKQAAVFVFGPTPGNPSVPDGAFLMRGVVDLKGGRLELEPDAWLVQPPGYVMVGMAGMSDSSGRLFGGNMASGFGCSTFSLRREIWP
jgi:hypothetical protein